MITDENKEKAATAIAEFIRTTLKEDLRIEGESCWGNVEGSIFLVVKNEETEEYNSIRNLPFSLNPEYSRVFDEKVIAEEIFEET